MCHLFEPFLVIVIRLTFTASCSTSSGPKTYFASADVLSQGTTRLHLDLTSAVNCMAWTGSTGGAASGSFGKKRVRDLPGSISNLQHGARWVIFAPEDASKLATYLKARLKLDNYDTDPIHAQQTFITEDMLRDLAEKDVYPYVINQKSDQAVFIPAGAAHQVRRSQYY